MVPRRLLPLQRGRMWKDTGKASGMLMFCFLVWVVLRCVCSVCESSLKSVCLWCGHLCLCIIILQNKMFKNVMISVLDYFSPSMCLFIRSELPRQFPRLPQLTLALACLPLLFHWYWWAAGARSSVWELTPGWEGPGREGLEEQGGEKGEWMYVKCWYEENLSACGYQLKEPMVSGDWYVKHFSFIVVFFLKKA